MKRKYLLLIIAAILALSVSGCGSTNVDEKPSAKKEVQKESKTENKKKAEKETEKKKNVKDSKKAEEEKNVSQSKKEEQNSSDKNTNGTSSPRASSSKPASKPASTSEPSKPAPAPEPGKPAPTPQPTPTPQPEPEPPVVNHYWVPETREERVWVEDYEYRTFCSCGADITDCMDMHYADGCNGSYYAKQVPSGGHYETQMVETGRYICSGCGAVK